MTGRIPPYGENFTRKSTSYHPAYANRVFVLKIDNEWFIRSDKTSKHWQVFHGFIFDQATPHGKVQPSMAKAMQLLLDGIAGEFYIVNKPWQDREDEPRHQDAYEYGEPWGPDNPAPGSPWDKANKASKP